MKVALSTTFLLISIISYGYTLSSNTRKFKLLPQPQQLQWQEGKGLAYHELRGIRLVGTDKMPVLYDELDHLPISLTDGAGILTLIKTERADLPKSPEGYSLALKNGQVTIYSRSDAGLFYGCQTLRQLLEDARDQHIGIPPCNITDFPDQAYRAVHLDLKHHLETGNYYYEMVDRLAQIKVNGIIAEFEDKLRYRKAPIVGASNAISVDEFAAISRYAKERYVEISPLIQGLGHASFILKHKQYHGLRDDPSSDWVFDPLQDSTYQLQFSLYEDAIAATPGGKYLHVGGDEVGDLGFSALAKKSGKKPVELQMYWLKKVCDFARDHDRIPIFWDDMIFKLSGVYETTYVPSIPEKEVLSIWKENEYRLDSNLHLFPENCVFMRWSYGMQILGERKAVEWYKKHDVKVMAATAAQTMWPMLPRENSNFYPIKDFSKLAVEKKLEGMLCTSWDDTSPHHETVWRGLNYFAFLSWNYEDIKVNDANVIYRHRFYGPQLSDSASEFQDLLEQSVTFWETALLESGSRSNYPDKINLITLPDAGRQGEWSKKYAKRILQAKDEVSRYESIKKKIIKAKNTAVRNLYSLEVMYQINEFQIYAAKLLLLLNDYDKTTSAELRNQSRAQILEFVKQFSKIRKELEEVYRSTRTLDKPLDYVVDKNYHRHLANGTISDDWMFVYELAINNAINLWLGGNIGVQTWTFRMFTLEEAIAKSDSAGVKNIEAFWGQPLGAGLKDSFGISMSSAGRAKLKEMLEARQMSIVAMGVIGPGSREAWVKAFDLAKEFNMRYVTSEPNKMHWDMIDSMAGAYGIKIAIHDHPVPTRYWHPDSVLAAIVNHKNIGACADVGHWARSGLDPVTCLKKLEGHIIGVHLKDIKKFGDRLAEDTVVSLGVIDFPAIFAELKRQKFDGLISIEQESKWLDNLADVISTVKYFRRETQKIE